MPTIGDAIEVFCPDDNQIYPGKVKSFEPCTGAIHVSYDDSDQ